MRLVRLHLCCALLVLIGCGDDGAGSGTSATTSTGGTANVGGGGEGGTDGGGGVGGAGGAVCIPGETQPCYTGPAGTESVGLCKSGERTCLQDGSAFGDCEGETVPVPETCSNPGDEDCDGETNESGSDCACEPGSTTSCYSADPATLGVGPCVGGTQVCNANGLGYGPCVGEVTPVAETCVTPEDDDCDGDAPVCLCTPGAVSSCYSADPATIGVGICVEGTQVCENDGLGFGPCSGEVTPAPESCATAADDDCDGMTLTCTGSHIWSKQFVVSDTAYLVALAVDAAGNVAIAGRTSWALDLGGGLLTEGGSNDVFIAKFDPNGNHLWSKRTGSGADQGATSVAFDAAGNVVVVGSFLGTVNFGGGDLATAPTDNAGDVFVAKLDPDGNHIWSKRFGDDQAQAGEGVATDPMGNVLVTGYIYGTVNFGGGPLPPGGSADAFLLKLDIDGNHVWSKRFGDVAFQSGYGVAADLVGNVVFAGFFNSAMDFGGGVVTAPTEDGFVAKYDPGGTYLWAKQLGGVGTQRALTVTTDPSSNVIVGGEFSGTAQLGGGGIASGGGNDIFVAKYDPLGTYLWADGYGGPGQQSIESVAADLAANVLITGSFATAVDFGGGLLQSNCCETRAYTAKFAPDGAHLWSRNYSDVSTSPPQFGEQWGMGIAADAEGNVLVGGRFADWADLGGGPVQASDHNLFLAKYAP